MLLTSKDIFDNIDLIVEKAYLDFTFMLIGDEFFTDKQKRELEALGLIIGRRPMIELLYILVRQRSTEGYRKDVTLNRLLQQVAETGVLPVINDTHQYSIEHAKAEMNEAIDNSKSEVKKYIKRQILEANNEFKNDVAVERLTTIPNMESKNDMGLSKILLGVAGITALSYVFSRAFTTAMTNTVNNAVIDEATMQSSLGTAPEDLVVYKQVINDSSLCPWCNTFYTNPDGTPKEYSLSELQSNGSNAGLPKSQWKPVVGATHPRCRCELQYKSSES